MSGIEVRESMPHDLAAIESLYPEAFPAEDLLPLVRDLLQEPAATLSLVAVVDSGILGHGLFTMCGVNGSEAACALLGPLAVTPACQKRGLGSAIVRAGLRCLEDAGVSQVFVLGDPAYYGRFGFRRESHAETPFALPDEWLEAWQSKRLGAGAAGGRGRLTLPRPWLRPALWQP